MSSLHRYDNSDALSPVQLWWLFSFILQLVEAQTWDIEKWKIQLNYFSETIFLYIYFCLCSLVVQDIYPSSGPVEVIQSFIITLNSFLASRILFVLRHYVLC